MKLQSVGNKSRARHRRGHWSTSTSSFALMLSAGAGVFSVCSPALAAETWTGTTSTDWFTASNWTPTAVPTGADTVVINAQTPNPTSIATGNAFADLVYIANGGSSNATLTVSNGSTLTSSAAILASGGSSSATAVVTGTGSAWTNASQLTVGDQGTGFLDIFSGAVVTDVTGIVAANAGSHGTANISGAGSTWTNSGDIKVGQTGTGAMIVSAGGAVTNNNGYIGFDAGASGTATVDGAGSSWTNMFDLMVGDSGTGTLNVSNGATVTAKDSRLGHLANGSGHASVDGAGSLWDAQSFVVGYYGTGTIDITNGGHVTASTWSSIASSAGSNGTMTVDGAGSSFVGSSWFDVGEYGTGTLFVRNGGTISNIDGYIGDLAGSTGWASVDGAGSKWTNSSNMYVGNWGDSIGTLRILNGGVVSGVDGFVGYETGSVGTVAVDGVGSKWTNSGDLYVSVYGAGTLAVSNGGAVTNAIGYVGKLAGSTGTVTIDGAGSTWASTASTYIGVDGVGSLAITNGGSAASGLSIVAGYNAGSLGTMSVDGAGSSLDATSDIVLGVLGSGSLTLSNGGGASAVGDILLANQTGATGAFNIGAAAGSAAQAAGMVTATAVLFGPGTGSLNFNHTETAYNFATPITGLGTINQLAGVTKLTGNSSGFTGTTNVTGGGLFVNGTLGGVIDVTGGLLGGSGTIGDVNFGSGGTLAPGNSIGTLNVANAVFSSGSVYAVELESGGTSDLIDATGTVVINGGNVTAIAFPDYAVGTTYTIVTAAGGVTGVFDGANFRGTAFIKPTLSYDANNVYLDLVKATFADLALTPNQKAAASGAESLGTGNALYDAIAALGTTAEVQAAYDAASGEIHASAKTALIEDSRFVREAANDRIRAAFGDAGARKDATRGMGVWTQGFGAQGHAGSDGNAAALDRFVGGLFVGMDGEVVDNWMLGVMAGYSHSTFRSDARASSGDATSFHLGAYGGTEWNGTSFRFGAAYSWHDVDVDRAATFAGFSYTLPPPTPREPRRPSANSAMA